MSWKFSNTLKIEVQANTIDNLLHTLDEIKEQISEGYTMRITIVDCQFSSTTRSTSL